MVYGSAKGRQRALARPSLPGAPGCKAGPPEREHLGSRSPAAHVFRASASDRSHARPMTHLGPSAQHKAHNPKTCARLPSSHPRAQCRNKSRACRKSFDLPPLPALPAAGRLRTRSVGCTQAPSRAQGVCSQRLSTRQRAATKKADQRRKGQQTLPPAARPVTRPEALRIHTRRGWATYSAARRARPLSAAVRAGRAAQQQVTQRASEGSNRGHFTSLASSKPCNDIFGSAGGGARAAWQNWRRRHPWCKPRCHPTTTTSTTLLSLVRLEQRTIKKRKCTTF